MMRVLEKYINKESPPVHTITGAELRSDFHAMRAGRRFKNNT